jgi:signal transduction histidine kinase
MSTAARTIPHPPSRPPAPSGTVVVERPDVALLLAHDVRTPLGTLALNLEFALAEGAGLSDAVREALEDCLVAHARMTRDVDDMADAAQARRDGLRAPTHAVDACEVLDEMVRNLPPAAKPRVTLEGQPALTRCDRGALARVFGRLCEWTLRQAASGAAVEVRCFDRVVSMRARTSSPAGPARASLAVHYADAILHALGGGVWTEITAAGDLLVTVALPP